MSDTGSPWLTDEQQQVWRQWLLANNELNAAIGRQLGRDSGMSLPDFQVLVRLSEAPEATVRIVELADDMQWERSRLSHQLTRMQRRGLICRRECPQDRRGAFAELTEQGRALIEQAAPGHARAVRSIVFDDLSQGDLAVIDRVTAGILARVAAQGAE